MCCKNYLGFHEITKEELVKEQDLSKSLESMVVLLK